MAPCRPGAGSNCSPGESMKPSRASVNPSPSSSIAGRCAISACSSLSQARASSGAQGLDEGLEDPFPLQVFPAPGIVADGVLVHVAPDGPDQGQGAVVGLPARQVVLHRAPPEIGFGHDDVVGGDQAGNDPPAAVAPAAHHHAHGPDHQLVPAHAGGRRGARPADAAELADLLPHRQVADVGHGQGAQFGPAAAEVGQHGRAEGVAAQHDVPEDGVAGRGPGRCPAG